jgi:uncharacterized membrane protein YozB (DUF420 family)
VSLTLLPSVNAVLNATAALALLAGYAAIRRGRPDLHRVCMLTAFGVSTLFLASYLTYHYEVGSRPYGGSGPLRITYFAILISHTVLAVAVVPLALTTLHRAVTAQFARHRRIARWTLPIWVYVSVTGVVVYLMLYHG